MFFVLVVVDSTLYQSAFRQAKINRMTFAVTPERDDDVVRMAMSSAEPEDGNQLPLPLPLEEGEASVKRVVPFTPGRPVAADGQHVEAGRQPRLGLQPPRGPLSEAEVAHRRAMLEHLTRQSA